MKKALFVVALVALLVPTTFAGRSYLGNATSDPFSVDKETTDNSSGNFEVKAENYNWPVSYDFVDAAVIPVKMEIGYWIKLNTKDKTLVLKQVHIHDYAGAINIGIETNVNIQVKAYWTKDAALSGITLNQDYLKLNTSNASDGVLVDASTGESVIKVCLGLKEVDVKAFQGIQNAVGTCVKVGTVTLQVRPMVRPNVTGGCDMGNYVPCS